MTANISPSGNGRYLSLMTEQLTRDQIMHGLRQRGWFRLDGAATEYQHPNGGTFNIDEYKDGMVAWKRIAETGQWPLTHVAQQVEEPLPFADPRDERVATLKATLSNIYRMTGHGDDWKRPSQVERAVAERIAELEAENEEE